MVAPIAPTFVRDLLIGQHGAEHRAPVHRDLGQVRQSPCVRKLAYGLVSGSRNFGGYFEFGDRPRLLRRVVKPTIEQLEEDPLCPPEVFRVCRVDLTIPVVTEAQRLHLTPKRVDVRLGRLGGVLARLDGVLLGRQPEGIPTHRMKHAVSTHSAIARQDVRCRVALGMPDVQAGTAGIGKHVQRIELPLGFVEARFARVRRPKGLVFVPEGLPLGLDLTWRIVTGHGKSPCHQLLKESPAPTARRTFKVHPVG